MNTIVGCVVVPALVFGLAYFRSSRTVLADLHPRTAKRICGGASSHLESGRPAGPMASLRRNLLFLLPGAKLVAVGLESLTIVRDPQGQRLGDRLEQTQVVEGLAASELVRAAAGWCRLGQRRERRRQAA